ncbi:MAG: Rne/Rng family ribonuclease [Pseudolabrys sp.]|nr:Rne/Rng family ribonuclease [Pseudolabrys sp.]
MTDKMLIDATHPEETRVVVLRGNRVEEFDFESANRKQLRGNIYLAKVTRVEPSLQAAFIEYGGNRHGFLAFSEIHPDYYQIPVADREALLAEEARAQRAADDDADNRSSGRSGGGRGGRSRHRRSGADRPRDRNVVQSDPLPQDGQPAPEMHGESAEGPAGDAGFDPNSLNQPNAEQIAESAAALPTYEAPAPDHAAEETAAAPAEAPVDAGPIPEYSDNHAETGDHLPAAAETAASEGADDQGDDQPGENGDDRHDDNGEQDNQRTDGEQNAAPANGANGGDANVEANGDDAHEDEHVESVGGADALEEAQERTARIRPRQYKIQEVIKRRQVMLVQVVKEERGSKGAALTTYLSLAGRYSVLMPNTARGGGISRKITSGEDRSRLKEIAQDLEVPEGMGVILRTAGASRTKLEVKRDFEYLLRLWETVRDLTLKSMAPKLVYEEGSLTKRSIRDLYNKEIDEIIVSGEAGYKEAREFMRMLMPSHAKNVKLYKDSTPLFTRYGIESQLDAMFSPTVQLKSGGYIVINQTEALVAIDVNSGRATREHHIEDTALKTNCEAADEVARQLRLRDLAGLIVIDFIDMDEGRNNRTVERRMKDALKHDRARIQVGRISHFGLLEMSRQRIRTSVLESSTEKCPVCGGSGHVRSVSSVSLQLLRAIEEMLNKGATHNVIVRTRSEVALYVLNHKRGHLRALEERYRITITVAADETVNAQTSYAVDRGEQVHTAEAAKALAATAQPMLISEVENDEDVLDAAAEAESAADEAENGEAAAAPAYDNIETVEDAPEEDEEASGRSRGDGDSERDGTRRRRRGRGRGRGRNGEPREPREGAAPRETVAEHAVAHEDHDDGDEAESADQQARDGGATVNGEAGDIGENGERRRRRRGRRGGRRNRQRNGDAPLPSDNGAPEQALQDAVADLDGPPASYDAAPAPAYAVEPEAISAYERPAPPLPTVHVAVPTADAPAAASAEPPRRRSTIREPAPIALEGVAPPPAATLPPPAPVIVSTAPEEAAAPKRGWWGKRLLGDKS